jgi:hypothetical protein
MNRKKFASVVGSFVSLCSVVLILAASMGSIIAPSASAAVLHPFVGSFGGFANPQSIAVDRESGDVFVLDAGSYNVQKFTADGTPSAFSSLGTNVLDGSATPNAFLYFDQPSAAQVAVDSSGGAADGNLYVTSSLFGLVDIFAEDGTFKGEITAINGEALGAVCGVAVGPGGDVYVGTHDGRIGRFRADSNTPSDSDYVSHIVGAVASCNLAVAQDGSVYATPPYAAGSLIKYATDDFGETSPAGTEIDSSSTATALSLSSGDVYADSGDAVSQYDPSRTLLSVSGSDELSDSHGVAVNDVLDQLYASDSTRGTVSIFGPLVTLPDVATGTSSDVTPTSARVAATVNPAGRATRYTVQYGETENYGLGVPSPPADVGSGNNTVPVDATLSNLKPNTLYYYRIAASNENGTVYGASRSFTTLGAAVTIDDVKISPDGSIAFSGAVDMRGIPEGRYHFTVSGVDTSFGKETPETAVAEGDGSHPVTARMVGLPRGQLFEVRLIVRSASSHNYSAPITFEIPADAPFVPRTTAGTALSSGCPAPRIGLAVKYVDAGSAVRVVGSGLGLSGTVRFGKRTLLASDYSENGFTFAVPSDASGPVDVQIDCGVLSNRVPLFVVGNRRERFSLSVRAKIGSTLARASLRVPAGGTLMIHGNGLTRVYRRVTKAGAFALRISLTERGRRLLRKSKTRSFVTALSASYSPNGAGSSTLTRAVKFRLHTGR